MNRPSPTVFLAALLLAACGGSGGGGGSGPGGSGGDGGPDCTQAECVGGGDYREVDSICLPGGCTDVGLRDPYGEIRRGTMLIAVTTERVEARTLASGYVRVFHALDNRGEAIDCARILGKGGIPDDGLNVVSYFTTAIRSSGYATLNAKVGPVAGLPVNDASTRYPVYVALFSGDRDPITHHPTGVMMAEGCVDGDEGMIVADGEPASWADPDDAHVFGTVTARPPAAP